LGTEGTQQKETNLGGRNLRWGENRRSRESRNVKEQQKEKAYERGQKKPKNAGAAAPYFPQHALHFKKRKVGSREKKGRSRNSVLSKRHQDFH